MVIEDHHAEPSLLGHLDQRLHIIGPVAEGGPEVHQAGNLLIVCAPRDRGPCQQKDD